jgi:hypothetical protein
MTCDTSNSVEEKKDMSTERGRGGGQRFVNREGQNLHHQTEKDAHLQEKNDSNPQEWGESKTP